MSTVSSKAIHHLWNTHDSYVLLIFINSQMKTFLFPSLFLGVLFWMGQHHWYIACLIATAFVVLFYAFIQRTQAEDLAHNSCEYAKHARAYHAAQILLGNIQRRVFWGHAVDFDDLLKQTNERMQGAKELNAYSFLQFDDGSSLPHWDPDVRERADHVIKSLWKIAHIAEELPDGEKYYEEIMDFYHRLSARFDKEIL